MCVCAHMSISSSFLIAAWTKVGEGAHAHSSDEAKVCRAQDELYSISVRRLKVRAFLFCLSLPQGNCLVVDTHI